MESWISRPEKGKKSRRKGPVKEGTGKVKKLKALYLYGEKENAKSKL